MNQGDRRLLLTLLSIAHSLNHSFFWIASPLLLLIASVVFFVGFGMRPTSQAITGYVSDKIGITASFYILTLFAAAAFILSFFVSDVRENSNAKKNASGRGDFG